MNIDSTEVFESTLRDRLRASTLPDSVVRAAITYARDELEPAGISGSLQARFRFPFQDVGYIVSTDDVNLLGEGIRWAFAAATLGMGALADKPISTASTALGIAQIGFVIFEVLDKLHRKAAKVTKEQYAVVGALKSIGRPATLAEVSRLLESQGESLTVGQILDELSNVRSLDNTVTNFVAKDDHGRWFVVGI